MNTATIVHVKPGHIAPEEYLKIVTEKCPTVFGFAGRENGKLKCEASPSSVPLAELKELNEAFKDSDLVMFFGNYPKAVLPDDVQPWSLSKPNDKGELEHFLLMFFEGGFEKYEGLNGDHTAEYCVSDEVIFPRMDKAFNDAGKDIPKFIESLRQPGIKKSLSNSFEKRGVFLFMPEEGEIISFGENDVGGSYDWGTTSNAYGYTEKGTVVAQAAQAVNKGLSFLRGRGATSTSVTSGTTPPPDPAPKPDAPHPDADPDRKVVEVPKPSEAPETRTIDGVVQYKTFPPPKLHGKARNLWVRTFNRGELPDGCDKSDFFVWVESDILELAKQSVSSKNEVESLARGVHNLRKKVQGEAVSAGMREANAEAEAAREILLGKENKTPSRSTVREKAPSPSDYLPVISDTDKEKSLSILSTYLDPRNEKRPSPVEIQHGERKWPSFSQSIGLKFEELLFIPVKTLNELFDNNKIAVAAFIEMRQKYIDGSGIKLEDLVLTSTKTEEKVAVQPAASAAKPGGGKLSFLRGKSAA